MEQAKLTGQMLYQSLSDIKFDKLIIECSPFIRTMQTASQIANEFKTKEIIVNFQACEILIEHDFKFDPIPSIEFSQNE